MRYKLYNMSMDSLHSVAVMIIRELYLRRFAHYSDLMRPTGLESDVFKFHVRKLVKLGIIEKLETGKYALTPVGKELANRFDYDKKAATRQPKMTTITILRRKNEGTYEYLFHQRSRNPYFGYWGVLGGTVAWGESFEDAARRGVRLRTGLELKNLRLSGYYRQRDFDRQSGVVLEDKLFVVFVADQFSGELAEETEMGRNCWRTIEDIAREKKYFVACLEMIHRADGPLYFVANDSQYLSDEY